MPLSPKRVEDASQTQRHPQQGMDPCRTAIVGPTKRLAGHLAFNTVVNRKKGAETSVNVRFKIQHEVLGSDKVFAIDGPDLSSLCSSMTHVQIIVHQYRVSFQLLQIIKHVHPPADIQRNRIKSIK